MIYLEKLEQIVKRVGTIEQDLTNSEIIKNQTQYQALMKELAQLRPIVQAYEVYRKLDGEMKELKQGLQADGVDREMKRLYEEELRILEPKKEKTRLEIEDLLLQESDENAGRDVIMEIRAGTGGDEAALFVSDLFRMYTRYAAAHSLKTEVMSSNPTGKGGFKEVIFSVSGRNAHGRLKYETGIHRVQRVPETEASGRIHTSAVTVAMMVEADDTEIEINPKDLKIDVFRASGAGGQHVNKTESAVRITHLPTGFVISCQDERSQHKNKAKAMRVLRARIFEMRQMEQDRETAKTRKQQVGSGDRSGKIRTYNYLERRVTDHRIGLTLHALDDILDGHLDPVIQALADHERNQKLDAA